MTIGDFGLFGLHSETRRSITEVCLQWEPL
jgi:hypothetical protein